MNIHTQKGGFRLKHRRKLFILPWVLILAFVLTGCARFDAEGYAKASLDALYKGDFSLYSEITSIPAEEAEQVYQAHLDSYVDADLSRLGLDRSEISPESLEALSGFYRDLLASFRYTVLHAEKDDEGEYSVTVSYEPLQIQANLLSIDDEALRSQAMEPYLQLESISDSDIVPYNSDYLALRVEAYRAALDKAEYGLSQTFSIQIVRTDDQYQLSSDSLILLNQSLYQ